MSTKGLALGMVCVFAALIARTLGAAEVAVDFARPTGVIRRLNGMNGGPQVVGRGELVRQATAEFAALAAPNVRLHDIPLAAPGLKVCDVPHIFPIYNAKADPKDAANYYFEPTDDYIRRLKACGVESITFRLGTSIEWTHPRTYFARRPKDLDQFAEVCAGIVRHYTTGWDGGFDAGKVYWEIWNEPNSNGTGECWEKGQDIETYWPLYVAVARRIKAEFPDARVGGPSSNTFDLRLAARMADVCRAEGAALDFFSWHQYISSLEPFDGPIRELREMFDRKGFAQTELHLNEWHWMPACWSDLGDRERLLRWEDTPDGLNGIESAAAVLHTLVGFQATALDMADYYMAFDFSSWGLYDRRGNLRPTYWPLAWFGQLAQTSAARVASSSGDPRVAVLAGVTADGRKTALVSDFRPDGTEPLTVALAGLPSDSRVAVTALRADGIPRTESVRLRDGRLTLDRAAGSGVYRIETPAGGIVAPDGTVGVDFTLDGGRPQIAVSYAAARVATLDLGLVLDEPYQGGFTLEDFELGGADTTWKPVWGDRAEIRDAHRDYTVRLRENGPKARGLRIEMRAYPEGFAFRYVIEGAGRATVLDESTRVVFAPGTVAWPIYDTEDTYPAEPVDAANLRPASDARWPNHYMLPLTVRRPDGVCASLFEAYVRRYPRAKGEAADGGTKIRLIGDMAGHTRGTATVDLPFESPWRAIQVGRDAAALVENATLVLNLNPPCALADTSYIRPGLCLSDLGNCALNNRDILAAATRERANGIRHFQIDWGWYGTEWTWSAAEIATYLKHVPDADTRFPGWRANAVADPRRTAKGYVPYRADGFFDYGTVVDLDLPALVKDLAAVDVDLALYLHGRVLEESDDLDALFAHYRRWGVAGLKPGFVRYGDAASTDWKRRLVEAAARHGLWLDVHDRHVPDGMQRTYPNLLLCEGGGGEEGDHPVRQDVSLPFARCLVGPFDYTPKLFREDRTHAHSVAMLLVYPGPAAVLRGPAVGRGWGPELDFAKALPMTYDETVVPVAEIGRHLVVARRKGGVWYVAGICGEAGYTGGFMLDFLGRGGKWKARLFADGEKGRVEFAERTVAGGTWFPVRMDRSGGFALILENVQ